ncbi:MAG: hypothetical protein ABSF26_26075 [Thermoguttaceae bacterium]
MRVAIIYDTSFLMSERYWDIQKYFEEMVERIGNWPPSERIPRALYCGVDWTTFVPVEVKKEIRGHFENPDKERWAKAARKRLASLLAAGCKEIELSKEAEPVSYDDLLGADSDTDKRIVGFAQKLSYRTVKFGIVFVASDDGGILCDVAKMNRAKGLNAFGVTPDNEQNESRKSVLSAISKISGIV